MCLLTSVIDVQQWCCITASESIAADTAQHRSGCCFVISPTKVECVVSRLQDLLVCTRPSLHHVHHDAWCCRSSLSSRTFASAATGAKFRYARGMTQPWVTHPAISDAGGVAVAEYKFTRALDNTGEELLWTIRGSPPALMMTRRSASRPSRGSATVACVFR